MITNKNWCISSAKPGIAGHIAGQLAETIGLDSGLMLTILRHAVSSFAKRAGLAAKDLNPVEIAKQVAEEHYDEATSAPEQAKTKKQPRRKVVIFDTETAERAAITPSPEDSILLFIDVERAVANLTDRQREVYNLTLDGKSRDEIAGVLNVTPRRIGQLQAEVYAVMERALAVRLPGLTLPPLPLPDDDGRHRKHVTVPEMLQIGAGDLAEPGLKRLLLVDLLLAHHRRQARTPLIQTAAAISNIKLDSDAWGTCDKILVSDSQVDWVAAAQGMREHPTRMGGLLLLLRVRQVVALLRDFVSRGVQDNNNEPQVPMR
jgi:DNA-binding CsgD family transcriptional regulator